MGATKWALLPPDHRTDALTHGADASVEAVSQAYEPWTPSFDLSAFVLGDWDPAWSERNRPRVSYHPGTNSASSQGVATSLEPSGVQRWRTSVGASMGAASVG
jgi:hypothetical protein